MTLTVRCVLTMLAFTMLAGCRHTYIDAGAGTKAPAGMELTVLDIVDAERGIRVKLLLRNGSAQPLAYRGYSVSQPIFRYEYLTNAAWARPVLLMCGYEVRTVSLPPGQEVTVTTDVGISNRLQRVRIGIPSESETFTIWSPMIDPATLRAGAPAR